MLRQSEEEVIGRPAGGGVERPRAEQARAPARRRAATPGGRRSEVQLVLGGEWKTFEVKVTAMRDAAGRPGGRVLVLEDLTELIKAQQLAAWNEAARRIAHEIKNPLTPIRLSAERLLRKHRQGDRRPRRGDRGGGGASSSARSATCRGWWTSSRATPACPGRSRRRSTSPAWSRTPSTSIATSSRAWRWSGEIDAAARRGLDRRRADPPRPDQPARQRRRGHRGARPGDGCRAAARRRPTLEIHVADTGRGIPAAAREKLFLPYFSTKGRGTGLGLAIVHRIVTDHHGTIRVEDNRPHGTVFTIELPG